MSDFYPNRYNENYTVIKPLPTMVNNTAPQSEESFDQYLAQAQIFSDEPSITLRVSPATASALLFQLRLTANVPGNNGAFQLLSEEFIKQLEETVAIESKKQRLLIESEISQLEQQIRDARSRWQVIDDFTARVNGATASLSPRTQANTPGEAHVGEPHWDSAHLSPSSQASASFNSVITPRSTSDRGVFDQVPLPPAGYQS